MVTMFLSQKTRLWRSPRKKKSRTNHRKKLFGITEEMLRKSIYSPEKTQQPGRISAPAAGGPASPDGVSPGLPSSAAAADTLGLTRLGGLRVFPPGVPGTRWSQH